VTPDVTTKKGTFRSPRIALGHTVGKTVSEKIIWATKVFIRHNKRRPISVYVSESDFEKLGAAILIDGSEISVKVEPEFKGGFFEFEAVL
jgi:hypothetical protein